MPPSHWNAKAASMPTNPTMQPHTTIAASYFLKNLFILTSCLCPITEKFACSLLVSFTCCNASDYCIPYSPCARKDVLCALLLLYDSCSHDDFVLVNTIWFNINSCFCTHTSSDCLKIALLLCTCRTCLLALCSMYCVRAFACDYLCTYQKCAVQSWSCCSCMRVFPAANNILASALLHFYATIFAAVFFVLACLYT